MRSTATITAICGNSHGTAFLEGATGALWYVSSSGEASLLATSGVRDVQMGYYHGAVLYHDGSVSTFFTDEQEKFYSNSGQLGIGDVQLRPLELYMTPLRNIVSVSCGVSFMVALDAAGDLWFAGSNDHGQFGIGTSSLTERKNNHGSNVFVKGNLSGVASVVAGSGCTFATLMDGTVLFAGRAICRSSGIGNNGQYEYPNFTPVGLKDVVIHPSHRRTLAVSRDGTIHHTGDARTAPGTVRNVTFEPTETWNELEGLRLKQVVVRGDFDVIAIDADDNVVACGSGGPYKFGSFVVSRFNLVTTGEKGEQVAVTPEASFIRQNGEWISCSAKNPNMALSVRGSFQKDRKYEPMAHPADWGMATQLMRSLNLTWEESQQAAAALA